MNFIWILIITARTQKNHPAKNNAMYFFHNEYKSIINAKNELKLSSLHCQRQVDIILPKWL